VSGPTAKKRGCLPTLVFLAIIAVVVIVVVAASSGGKKKPGPVKPALAADINSVQVQVENFQAVFGIAIKSDTPTNETELASIAQTVHGDLDGLKSQIAVDSPNNTAGNDLTNAANELKNTMGAIGSYLATPNPSTLASFENQYQQAISDWNAAVAEIYRGTTSVVPSSLGT
jgi:hypothetical protein